MKPSSIMKELIATLLLALVVVGAEQEKDPACVYPGGIILCGITLQTPPKICRSLGCCHNGRLCYQKSTSPTDETCYRKEDKGASYKGRKSTTIFGRTCQRWSEQSPHKHTRTPTNYPNYGLYDNFCRNPDGENGPWCYTTDSDIRWEYCGVPLCGEPTQEKCYKKEDKGASYRGPKSTTVFGRTCQGWNEQRPHEHSRTPMNYLNSGLVDNFCRNPDGENGPWCYTTDSNKRWEYCGVPLCGVPTQEKCYKKEDKGASYRGPKSTTVFGRTCQGWSEQRPHEHSRTPMNYLNSGLVDNFCRNPDGENGPWCYTTDSDKRWEYCGVPLCGVPTQETCYESGDKGASYRGAKRTTKTGRTCQKWNEQHPHEHSRTPTNYLDSGLVDNFCRNPDGENGPWCYTTDPDKRWEYCGVPAC